MTLDNKLVLHIPERAYENGKLKDIAIKKPVKNLIQQLQEAGCISFYSARIKSCFKNRCYPEKIITIYRDDDCLDIVNLFKKWFVANNDVLRQESLAYEYNDALHIESLL